MPDFSVNNSSSGQDVLFIWDDKGTPPLGNWIPVLWRGFVTDAKSDGVSIPELIEANADLLKNRYLAWVYDFGKTSIKGKTLLEHMQLRQNFSYWWMTLFAEKSNYYKSTNIDDAIRLMAFDEWAKNQFISNVVLATANKPLAECMQLWCVNLGVAFEWQRIQKLEVRLPWLVSIYQSAPHALQALLWLMYYCIDRLPLRGLGLKKWQRTDGTITFFSYLFNLTPDAAKQGYFKSPYWAHLPEVLLNENCKTNWLHFYVKDSLLPTSKSAANMLEAFNKAESAMQHHVTMDTFLGFNVVYGTICDWCRLLWVGIRLKKEIKAKHRHVLNLWPLFEDDWRQSMFGQVAMNNLLNLNLFESALKYLPKQRCGVYLQENQGWEFALIQAWRERGHGRLIGAQHSTIRFWYLSYFFDRRTYWKIDNHSLPMPNQVTFNGPMAGNFYKSGGYPEADLVEVEALRYLHLGEDKVKTWSSNASENSSIRLLVLGDYLPINTQFQMNLLLEAVPLLCKELIIVVKPHPACPIQISDYPSINMEVTMQSIATLLSECDIAYSSAATSAALDAYCAGVPVISVLDPNTLNLSPLRGCAGALFVSTPEDLASALLLALSAPRRQYNHLDFFTTDSQLPRWRKLLLDTTQ